MTPLVQALPDIEYPDSDGEPMSDNTLQFEWISRLKHHAEAQYLATPNVFVAGDHLIYAVEGDPTARQAPDVYVAFGRPKGYRGSYKVWEESGVFPQVVIEVWSPSNRFQRMEDKREFYDRHGTEEYYIVYPDFPAYLEGWRRAGGRLVRVPEMNGFVSPRLGWRFVSEVGEIGVYGKIGQLLRDPTVLMVERDAIAAERDAVSAERDAVSAERDAEREKAAKLAAKLRELGIDPDAIS